MATPQSMNHAADTLPSPPAIAVKILRAVKDEESSFHDLAEIVKADPAIATKIMKTANSSFYGLAKHVDSLAQATSVIGMKALKNMALSFVIVNNFEKANDSSFDLDAFWKHSITTGVAAEIVAEKMKYNNSDIFVSALLQNIGILIMFNSRPAETQKVFDEKRVSGKPLWEIEEKMWGFHHAEVAAQLLESWNLPESIFQPIRNHLVIDEKCKYSKTSLVLKIAGKIASVYYGTSTAKALQEAQKLLGKYCNIDKKESGNLIDLVGEKAREMMDIFSIDSGDMQPLSVIIQQSNNELRKLNLSYEQVVYELTQEKQKAEKLAVELQKANERLNKLAFYDELTGMYNVRYFQHKLDDEIYRSKRYKHVVSLLLIDIDFFKKVNDSYGHLVGDIVLQKVAKEMCNLVRHSDVVARYGGEEFAIILPETGITGAKVIGQRIRRGIESLQIKHKEALIPVTISIGAASTEMEGVGSSRKALISYSDNALYQAKRAGRNRLEVLTDISVTP